MLRFNKGLENDFAQYHSQHLHRNEKILNKRMKLFNSLHENGRVSQQERSLKTSKSYTIQSEF